MWEDIQTRKYTTYINVSKKKSHNYCFKFMLSSMKIKIFE